LFSKDQDNEYDDTYEFIWGIKSNDDLTGSKEPNLYTLNDIDIILDNNTKTYLISIETIYEFDNGRDGEKQYIKYLFDELTDWMNNQGHDTTKELTLWDVFTTGNNISTEFESLEDLYATFKFMVKGFCGE
jgi:hypothetical protein